MSKIKIHDERYWNKRIAAIYAKREKELSAKIARLKERKREGWGYRRVYIEEYQVKKHTRGGHYANVMYKIK